MDTQNAFRRTLITVALVVAFTCAPTIAAAAIAPQAVKAPYSVTQGTSFTMSGTMSSCDETETVTHAVAQWYKHDGDDWVWAADTTMSATRVNDSTLSYRIPACAPCAGNWRVCVRIEFANDTTLCSKFSETIRVSSKADAIIWNNDGILTIPEKMAYRNNAQQLVVITGAKVGSKSGTLSLFEYRNGDWVEVMNVPARFGKNGLMDGEKRKAGNKTTPTGIWRMPSFAFGTAKKAPAGTSLKWKQITKKSYWSDKKGSTYNKWVTSSKRVSGERLINYKKPYKYAISSGYNAAPNKSVYGRGSCIFIHCRTNPQTAGCVSIATASMKKLVTKINPNLTPSCVIGTTSSAASPTYLYSY